MLKVDLHMHCKNDPEDSWIKYTAEDLVDKAKELGLDVIGITPHNKLFCDKKAIQYSKEQGILIIPGIEKTINKKHVLILNAKKDAEKIESVKMLKEYKEAHSECLIIAAHPFYPHKSCLGGDITRYKNVFDAWEFCHFYTKKFNPNKKLIRLGAVYNKPLVGNSDTHFIRNLGTTYSLVPAKKDIRNIVDVIKAGRVEVVTEPLKFREIVKYLLLHKLKGKKRH